MPPATHPFALATPAFPCPALAHLAGRAPLGGSREVVLAVFMVARLACGAAEGMSAAARGTRATAARQWLTSLALPAALRVPFARGVDATAGDDLPAIADVVEALSQAAHGQLDGAARAELAELARRLRARRTTHGT